jgi:hypothetical protein
MRNVSASKSRRRPLLRAASTALVASALLMPAAGRSDADHRAPSPPIALQIIGASPTTLTVQWEAGRARPVEGFILLRDGRSVASTADTRYTFTGLSCGEASTLGIVAFDSAGNRSELLSVIGAPDACPGPAQAPPPASQPAPVTQEPPGPPPAEPSPATASVPASPAAPDPAPREPTAPSTEMSWAGAGAFVWHETDVAPDTLGMQLRAAGFSWVAIRIHDGLAEDPVEGDWVRRFRAASGLPVGGWGVLRTEPEQEAELADRLLDRNSLDFYIANPEAEYKLSNDDGASAERFGRSQRFVSRFRALAPGMAAAVSSYCRADRQDIDWGAWTASGFAFLPQAYVNDLGSAAAPAACADGAVGFFPTGAVHPTVGVYTGQEEQPSAERYAALLDEAGTVGFSVYLAETRMYAGDWQAFGDAIAALGIARRSDEGPPASSTEGEGFEPSRRLHA